MDEKLSVTISAKIDGFKSSMDKVSNMMKEFGREAKENFNTGINIDVDKTKEEIKRLEDFIERTSKDIEYYQEKISKGFDYSSQLIKSNKNLEEAQKTLNNLKKDVEVVDTKPMGILGNIMQNLKNTFTNVGRSIKASFSGEAKEDIEIINKSLQETGKAGKSAGNGLTSMFGNGIKSLKRFALSLFGIQSIWRVLSKATSTYMSQNKELTSKIQGVWNALGTLVGPIVEALANVFLKLIGYLNVVTKSLFNFDIIAKANANTLKKYREQIKAVSGLDELTNLNQDNQGPQGLIDEDAMNLDPKIVKGLQDISEWLKDNWDWLDKVLIAFGLVFGASAVAGWLKNIGSLLGIAGTNGVGGAGLMGLASTLGWLAGLTALTVEIAIIYTYGKEAYETDKNEIGAIEDNEKLDDGILEIIKDNNKKAKTYKQNNTELNKYINSIQNEIKSNAQVIRDNQEWWNGLDAVQKVTATLTGKLSAKEQESKKAGERIKELTAIYGEYYARGQLTTQQIAFYNELLEYQNKKVEDNGTVIDKLGDKYGDLTDNIDKTAEARKDDIEIVKQEEGAYASLGSAMGRLNYVDFSTLQNKIDYQKQKLAEFGITADEAKQKLQQLTSGNWVATLSFEVYAKINAEALKKAVERVKQSSAGASGSVMGFMTNAFTEELEKLLRMLSGIGSYKIGTDLVKSDGLAYIHAGEQIVPADAVKGGWSGGNSQETNNLLRELIEVVYEEEFSANISPDDVGKASVNYIRNQNRIRGGSVI